MITDPNGVPIAWPDIVWPKIYTYEGKIYTTGLCTWFGGNDDPMDDGTTASGVNTKDNPTIIGCALPIPTCSATKGSPLPVMKYLKTTVEVSIPRSTSVLTGVPLIDVGPAMYTGHAIDLTQEAFKRLGGNLSTGILQVGICITPAFSLTARFLRLFSKS